MNRGFIKLPRDIVNWYWFKNANTFRVFTYLLTKVCYEPYRVGGTNITLQAGQIYISTGRIAKDLELSYQEVRTALQHLISTNDLTTLNHAKNGLIVGVSDKWVKVNQQPKQQPKQQHNRIIRIEEDVSNKNTHTSEEETVLPDGFYYDEDGYVRKREQ